MTIYWIFSFSALTLLGIGLALLEPTWRWLVKHRWAIDKNHEKEKTCRI